MKQMMVAAASVAMAVALAGCGGSPKGVAEDFVDAIIQREPDKALKCMNVNNATAKDIKELKEEFDKLGKDINDNKLEAEAFDEVINIPPENSGYTIRNGAKITGETATVMVQYKKGKDKKSEGMKVQLQKVDGSWVVEENGYHELQGLDTSDR